MRILLFSLLVLLTACAQPQEPEAIGERQDADELAEALPAPTPPIDKVLDQVTTRDNGLPVLKIHPVYHGSLVLEYAGKTIYVDPYGGSERYAGFANPDLVLITHTHGDHMDVETLSGFNLAATTVTAPQPVIDALPADLFITYHAMGNGDTTHFSQIGIEAVPAYNLPSAAKVFHPEGKFNGYLLTCGNQKLYIAGDTGHIPEMADFGNIDYAFLPINQPYTMTVAEAVAAVKDLRPAVVYPYHYRNQDGSLSDLDAFEQMVNQQVPDSEVRRANWYEELSR